MKKILLYLTAVILPLLFINNVSAASARIKLTTSNTNVSLGNTFTVTVTVSEEGGNLGSFEYSISHDKNYLSLISGEEYQADVGDGSTSTKTYTLKYKAIENGDTTIKVTSARILDFTSESELSTTNGSLDITIGNNSNKNNNNNSNQSSDNALKSLSIEGFDINPEFNKDTLEYKVSLSSDTNKIKVNAEKNDDKASITGIGEVEVKEGNNIINIVVTAENGSSRTYKINAYVEEQSPITVKIKGKKYTVIKKLINIDVPHGFEEKTIKIKDNEIDSFYNKKLDFTIIGLKDDIGNILLYKYEEKTNSYSKYSPIVGGSINIIVFEPERKNIPYKYHKSKFEYNGDIITGYALSEKSNFRVVYGVNVETGEKGFYLYDLKDNTIQRFYNDQVNIYIELINKIKIAFIIIGSFILFLTIIIIILLSRNVKFKKKYLQRRLNPIDNPIRKKDIMYQDLESTSAIKIKKERKHKKEKTFLDE